MPCRKTDTSHIVDLHPIREHCTFWVPLRCPWEAYLISKNLNMPMSWEVRRKPVELYGFKVLDSNGAKALR